MATGDMSGCVEITAAYGDFRVFSSGHYGILFDTTGNGSERIWGKDPTADVTNASFYLELLRLTCGSGAVQFYDGSAGKRLVPGTLGADIGSIQEVIYNFEDDPLICLTSDSTVSLCISAGNGNVKGFIKGYWGPPR